MNAEHTPVDAMTMVSLFINTLNGLRETVLRDRQAACAPPPALAPGLQPPKLLRWKLAEPAREAIETASVEVVALASDVEVRHLDFAHYGKSFIKRTKLHPDFYMQMALQLTMWRMHGVCCATYETGHTRAFYHGRTDTIRTASLESAAFVAAMESSTATTAEKLAALKTACTAHSEQVQRVLTGQGIDRHLLGLYIAGRLTALDPMVRAPKPPNIDLNRPISTCEPPNIDLNCPAARPAPPPQPSSALPPLPAPIRTPPCTHLLHDAPHLEIRAPLAAFHFFG